MRRTPAVLVSILVVLLMGGVVLWALQRRLIYFPDRSSPSIGLAGKEWENVAYHTEDHLALSGWYRAPADGRPVVLVFNGNAGNRAGRATLGNRLAASGLGVLLTDYRGYGGNPGHPDEPGLALDAVAARDFVSARSPEHPIVYFGESLGAAVAVRLAAAEPPAALVLRSPFTSLADVARVHYPWLPVGTFLKDRYPSLERIDDIDVPTLVIAGDADSIVPFEQSREIYDAAPGTKELIVVAGADHNDAALVDGPEVIGATLEFIADAMAG